jgi:L-lactate dehydrogenase (cytochrome)
MDNAKLLSAQQIAAHKTPTDCWIVVDGQVWDVTEFVPEHPGGAASMRHPTRSPNVFEKFEI